VSFADEDGKTRLSLSTYAEGLGPEAVDMLEGMEAGWNQALDRFARLINHPTQEKT